MFIISISFLRHLLTFQQSRRCALRGRVFLQSWPAILAEIFFNWILNGCRMNSAHGRTLQLNSLHDYCCGPHPSISKSSSMSISYLLFISVFLILGTLHKIWFSPRPFPRREVVVSLGVVEEPSFVYAFIHGFVRCKLLSVCSQIVVCRYSSR